MRSTCAGADGSSALAELIAIPTAGCVPGRNDSQQRGLEPPTARSAVSAGIYMRSIRKLRTQGHAELLESRHRRVSRNYWSSPRRLAESQQPNCRRQTAVHVFRHPRANNVATLLSPDAMLNRSKPGPSPLTAGR